MALGPGARLGPYEILSLLGRGGTGEVYEARDTRLDRKVAVKVLAKEVADDPDQHARFEREARVISQLNHPHICALHDVGESGGARYLVFELLEGETLANRLRRGALPIAELVPCANQIADALEAAHQRGVVHRDLKPANVMLTQVGTKLLDFGLAKAIDVDVDVTQTAAGTIVGTVAYMSPEQAQGKVLDARSDVFSFGAVLYELVSGQRAFAGSTTAQVLSAVLRDDPPALQGSPLFDSVVRRCLAKDPGQRFQTMAEVQAALQRAALGPGRDPRSIAVLPFANISAEPDNEYFCDGITEELIGALSKIRELRVAARTSAFAFKGRTGDLREIGRTLNVSTVLEGSVRKAGERLRVSAQLVDVASGYHLWSERYDRKLEDVFAIQDEIALAIVDALRIELLGNEKSVLERRHTESVEAYQLYLKGRHHWHKWTKEGFDKSRQCMERAIAIDPQYALAYTGLADVHLAMGGAGSRPTEILPDAQAALARALELDDHLAETWVLLAVTHLYERNWMHARRSAERALDFDPRSGHAYLLMGLAALYGGDDLDTALLATKQAVALDPLAPIWSFGLVQTYVARNEWDAAIEQIRAVLEFDPGFWPMHFHRGILMLAQGHPAAAVQAFGEAAKHSHDGPFAIGYQACALALAGERAQAEDKVAVLLSRSTGEYVSALSFAYAYLGLGPTARVFEFLERAYDELEFWLAWHVQFDPVFADLRADSRMIDLRRKIREGKSTA
jgi:serine/threonine protein kinase/tetratricopeptide (TPR) repeat protein